MSNLKIKKIHLLFNFLLFSPLLVYLGKRSLLAYDEGFYALQAKWILNSNNWIAPMWWGEISLDRTIGIQAIIAFSQKVLGSSTFSIYVPNIIASFLMIFFTYELHKELIDKIYPRASSLILATTYLWINYSHQASQDLIYSFLILFGIYFTIKFIKTKNNFFLIPIGLWIGLAFMLKTYLTILPLFALTPILIKEKIVNKKLFWIGIIIGFIPFFLWSLLIWHIYGLETYFGLFNKVIALSSNNTFTNPFYFYFWNLPVNIFPWTLLSIIGFFISFKNKNNIVRYFLFFYPLIIIFLMSCFSTKTSYYPLQLTPLIALNSYLGLTFLIRNNSIYINSVKLLNFVFLPAILILSTLFINSNYSNFNISSNDKFIISSMSLIFSISWILTNLLKTKKSKLLFSLVGPYLMVALLVQSGLITDANKELRLASENIIEQEMLKDKRIEVVKGNISSNFSHSKIIKISLLMPNIGNGINNLEELDIDEYAWTTESTKKDKEKFNYKIIDDSSTFKPWILIKRGK